MADTKKSCSNCIHRYEIKRLDYHQDGRCEHFAPKGFVCMGFADEGIATWMTGLNVEGDICEMYRRRPEKDADPVAPGLYLHFKGGIYEVLANATHTETGEQFVVYRPDGGDKVWARPVSMWNETVLLNGKEVKRFKPYPKYCCTCKYSHEQFGGLYCWGEKEPPAVDPYHTCESWKRREIDYGDHHV